MIVATRFHSLLDVSTLPIGKPSTCSSRIVVFVSSREMVGLSVVDLIVPHCIIIIKRDQATRSLSLSRSFNSNMSTLSNDLTAFSQSKSIFPFANAAILRGGKVIFDELALF